MKQVHVIPVFKNEDVEDSMNYRPISITSALSNVFEKVISEQIKDYLVQNKLLSPFQFGFRSKCSTTDALLLATEKIRLNIDNNNFVAAAMLDLSKAFDSISHEILFKKLKAFNFDAKAISVVKNFLTNRIQKVVLPHVHGSG